MRRNRLARAVLHPMGMKTPTVGQHMTASPLSIGRDQTLAHAHELMREHGVRHLPVLEGGRLVGLVSQRDLHLIEALSDVDPRQVRVEEAMTQVPYVVAADTPLSEVVEHMAEHKLGSAIVTEGAKVVGVFTTIDALKVLARLLRERRRPSRPAARVQRPV